MYASWPLANGINRRRWKPLLLEALLYQNVIVGPGTKANLTKIEIPGVTSVTSQISCSPGALSNTGQFIR